MYESIKEKPKPAAFVISFTAIFIYCQYNSELPFLGDAHHIWEVAKSFYIAGREISYVEYRGPFTFIFYNAIFVLSKFVGLPELTGLRIIMSLFFAAGASYIIPGLFEFILKRRLGLLHILMFALWQLTFFAGYFLYPQTDAVALIFFASGLLVLARAINGRGGSWYASAGILVAFAIMLRMNYAVSVPVLLIVIMLGLRHSRQAHSTTAFLVGCFLVPLVGLSAMNLSAAPKSNLLEGQLKGGLQFRKVEWNAGDATYPGSLVFLEERGSAILSAEGISKSKDFFDGGITVIQYARIWLKYPIDMSIIYGQHLFAGLDIKYNSVYIYNINKNIFFMSIINFMLLFLAIVFVGLNFRSWVIGQADRSLLFFALVLPALSAAPFIVEVRFFMPLIFGYSALGVFTLKDGVQAIFRKGLHVHCLGFIALCLLHSAAMYDHLKHVVLWQAW